MPNNFKCALLVLFLLYLPKNRGSIENQKKQIAVFPNMTSNSLARGSLRHRSQVTENGNLILFLIFNGRRYLFFKILMGERWKILD